MSPVDVTLDVGGSIKDCLQRKEITCVWAYTCATDVQLGNESSISRTSAVTKIYFTSSAFKAAMTLECSFYSQIKICERVNKYLSDENIVNRFSKVDETTTSRH